MSIATPSVVARLSDPSLLRYDLFLDGGWSAASDDARFDVTDPGTGESIGGVASATRDDVRRAIDAAAAALPELGGASGEGALDDHAPLVRPDGRARGRPRDHPDGRAGQAGRRGQGRDPVRRSVHRVVRRGGQAGLRRDDPDQRRRAPHARAEAADRRLRRDHALELPDGDDPAQGRPCPRRGLHDGAEARERDAALGARARRARRSRRAPGRCLQRASRQGVDGRRRARHEPDHPQAHLHRVDRGRQAADGQVRRDDQEGVARARRQRAADRVRRCRSRARRGGRDRVEVPEHRADVRVRQPAAGAGRDPRRVRRAVLGGGCGAADGERVRAGDGARAADRRGGRGEGRGARCGRAGSGRLW